MIRFATLLAASLLLGGCALTRVSENGHAGQVGKLNVVDMRVDDAKAVLTRDGYECDAAATDSTYQRNGKRQDSRSLSCSKKSMEVFCPQRRYVILQLAPGTDRVNTVATRIQEHSCF